MTARIFAALAALALLAWPILQPEGWRPLAVVPVAVALLAYAAFGWGGESTRAQREHAEWHYGERR